MRFSSKTSPDAGLLILRVGMGAAYIISGTIKAMGGRPIWREVGEPMVRLGLGFIPAGAWGLIATGTMLIGGALLAAGVLARTAAGLLAFTMLIATYEKAWEVWPFSKGSFDDYWSTTYSPVVSLLALLALALAGPGEWVIGRIFSKMDKS